MKTLSRKAQITKAVLALVTLGTLALSACKPQDIIIGNQTGIERTIETWVENTCPIRPTTGECCTMGETGCVPQ
jgi:hypothetical protein